MRQCLLKRNEKDKPLFTFRDIYDVLSLGDAKCVNRIYDLSLGGNLTDTAKSVSFLDLPIEAEYLATFQ